MIACLFGHSDFFCFWQNYCCPFQLSCFSGSRFVIFPTRCFFSPFPTGNRPRPSQHFPTTSAEASLGCRRTASSVAASPPWRVTSAAWIFPRRAIVPMPTSRATRPDARRPWWPKAKWQNNWVESLINVYSISCWYVWLLKSPWDLRFASLRVLESISDCAAWNLTVPYSGHIQVLSWQHTWLKRMQVKVHADNPPRKQSLLRRCDPPY